MSKYKLLEFCSKYCKSNDHNQCSNKWQGLGFEVICNCSCHFENIEKNIIADKRIHASGQQLSDKVQNHPIGGI